MNLFYKFLLSMYQRGCLTSSQLQEQVPARISEQEFEQIISICTECETEQ